MRARWGAPCRRTIRASSPALRHPRVRWRTPSSPRCAARLWPAASWDDDDWMLKALVLGSLLAWAMPARAASSLQELIARARALRLAEEPQWIKLGHWHKTLLGGLKSEADGPDFFLAPDGARDPAAELEATLRGVLGSIELKEEEKARGLLPPPCRFPARAAWLHAKLGFDVPEVSCPRLDEYWRRLQPESVSIIFSSYYLNNPASAFGHTFLRIRKNDPAVSPEKRELLDAGIDYSATADTSNPILY